MIALASFAKRWSYETFLRAHQISAIMLVCGAVWHLFSISYVSSLPVSVYLIVMSTLNLFMILRVVYRNKSLHSPWPRAFVSRVADVDGVVHIRLRISRHLQIKPGQHMNLWLPRVQFWSTHPFTIASSTWHPATGQMDLEFFVQARRGFTMNLWQSCPESATVERLVLFSGPHGQPIRHNSANTVIMVATGMGIWPMCTYIEEMVRTNRSRSATSRIILVYITQKLCMSNIPLGLR
jgi:predicted ferric reductase